MAFADAHSAQERCRSKKRMLIVAGVIMTLQASGQASAKDYPFSAYSTGSSVLGMNCHGPWGRTSGCSTVDPNDKDNFIFYWAQDTFVSAVGDWICIAYASPYCTHGSDKARVAFCGPGAGDSPGYVALELDGSRLSVNQARTCPAAVASGVLGQTGEADDTPARDRDTFGFKGRAGEKVAVTLARDGSSGSVGAVATLRVRDASGAVVGQRTGPVPLALELTLPGPVEIIVQRRPGAGDAFRGGYALEVAPRSGAVAGRLLVPAGDVEQ